MRLMKMRHSIITKYFLSTLKIMKLRIHCRSSKPYYLKLNLKEQSKNWFMSLNPWDFQ